MLLLVCTVDPDETIGFVLGLGKLDTEFLVGLLEMCDFVGYQAWMSVNREAWCQRTHLSSFVVYEGLHVVT